MRAPPPYPALPHHPQVAVADLAFIFEVQPRCSVAAPPPPAALRLLSQHPTPYAPRPAPCAQRIHTDTRLSLAPPLQFFDRECDALLSGWEDSANLNRDILLDLVAEIVSCYHYSRHFTGTGALTKYKAFVQGQVARKYAPGEPFVYRYFAHADLPSDHEAVSLYHMLMTLSH